MGQLIFFAFRSLDIDFSYLFVFIFLYLRYTGKHGSAQLFVVVRNINHLVGVDRMRFSLVIFTRLYALLHLQEDTFRVYWCRHAGEKYHIADSTTTSYGTYNMKHPFFGFILCMYCFTSASNTRSMDIGFRMRLKKLGTLENFCRWVYCTYPRFHSKQNKTLLLCPLMTANVIFELTKSCGCVKQNIFVQNKLCGGTLSRLESRCRHLFLNSFPFSQMEHRSWKWR